MGYRGPDSRRIDNQYLIDPLTHAGQTATWRAWVSASTGNPIMGIGGTDFYTERTITGVFGTPPAVMRLPETQTPGGMVSNANFTMTSREKIGRRDELLWNGELYRIEGDPVPSVINGSYISILKRGRSS